MSETDVDPNEALADEWAAALEQQETKEVVPKKQAKRCLSQVPGAGEMRSCRNRMAR